MKARQKRLGDIGSVSLDVRTEGSLKLKNKRSYSLKNIISGATNTIQPDSPEEEEVNFIISAWILKTSSQQVPYLLHIEDVYLLLSDLE